MRRVGLLTPFAFLLVSGHAAGQPEAGEPAATAFVPAESPSAAAEGPSAAGPGESAPEPVATASAEPARAEPTAPQTTGQPITSSRAVATAIVFVPGLALHGAGSYALGRRATARRLLALEGLGIGLLAAGGVLLFSTGAARDFASTGAALAMAGAGLFTVSFSSDLYSVLAPPGGTGRDPGWVPTFESELGYRFVFDPLFDYRNFVVSGLTGRYGALRLSPSLWSSAENANQRARAELAYRVVGPEPNARKESGTSFDVELALTEHRYGFEGFSLTTTEATLEGRWDLADFDPYLAGAFVDYALGVGSQVYHWDVAPDGSSALLIGGFGFGVFLGDREPRGGWVRVYYDHRHDGYAAGMLANGLGSGAIGHFGLEGLYYFTKEWGALLEAQIGSAAVVGASGLFRFGGKQ